MGIKKYAKISHLAVNCVDSQQRGCDLEPFNCHKISTIDEEGPDPTKSPVSGFR